MLTLKAEKREVKTSPDKIRKSGKVPAVFYGRKAKSTPISVPMAEFMKIWRETGEFSVLALDVGEKEPLDVLIHDVSLDAVSGHPIHADFYAIEKGRKLRVRVPLEFEGVSPAVKDLGGILIKVMHELEIEALPKDFPKEIVVNIGALAAFDSQILVSDIKAPAGVEIIANPEEVVAAVAEPKEEEEEKPVEAIDLSSIEVEKKGKEAKEGEGEVAAAPVAEAADKGKEKGKEKGGK